MTMEEFNRVNNRIFLDAIDSMDDSQFLAWVAMAIDAVEGELNREVARRLDRIALALCAYDVTKEESWER